MKLPRTLLIVSMILAATAGTALASEIYTNLTPSGGYATSGGYPTIGANFGTTQASGARFVAAQTAHLDSIGIPVFHVQGSDQFEIRIHESNGNVPGLLIENLGVHTALSGPKGSASVWANSAQQPLLQQGNSYWVICWPANGDTSVSWSSSKSAKGAGVFYTGPGWSYVNPANQGALHVAGTTSEVHGNLAPSGTHQIGPSWSVTGANGFGGSISRAASFVLAQDATLESLQLPVLNALFGGTDDVRIELKEDSSGVPSTLVEDLGVHSGFPLHGSTTSGQSTFPSVAKPTLLAGTTYWIVCSAAHADTWVRWAPNDKGAQGQIGTGSAGSWTVQNGTELALQVDGRFLGAQSYCTAGVSASGCTATLSTQGTPCAATGFGFFVNATGVEGDKDGLFFYGTNGRQANAWGNGTSYQCVVPPVKRSGLLTGSGTAGACDGSFSQDLNALWAQNPLKNPGTGATVQLQLWHRDPFNTSNQTTSLSDALEFTIRP
jgi:hypothetical protein